MSNLKLFAGNSNTDLAQKISDHMQIPLGKAKVSRFSDGENDIELLENVRGQEVFLIQSTCAPSAENLMELLIMSDALRRASAARITAVIPYFGYARQDRRVRSARVPITAKVVADMITAVGINRILTCDLHADQIQGFFNIPVDNVYATPIMLEDIRKKSLNKTMVVSPDIGGVVRARAMAKKISGADMAIIDKRRPSPNEAQVMHLIGDVKDCDCIIVDDIIDTANTLSKACEALKNNGAKTITAYITHPVLSGNAVENIENSLIDEIVVTNTIPLSEKAKRSKKIRQLDMSDIIALAIRRVRLSESLSILDA